MENEFINGMKESEKKKSDFKKAVSLLDSEFTSSVKPSESVVFVDGVIPIQKIYIENFTIRFHRNAEKGIIDKIKKIADDILITYSID